MQVKSPQFPIQNFILTPALRQMNASPPRNARNSGNLQVSTEPEAMSTETAVEASELHSPAEK